LSRGGLAPQVPDPIGKVGVKRLGRAGDSVADAPRIGVIGASRPSRAVARLAYEVGRLLGARGAVVLCGGLGGVMEEVARGVRETGGLTVGILPGLEASSANRYIDLPIVTGLADARNVIIVRSVQATIAIGGSYGTLSEIGFALRMGVPVIGLRTWGLIREGRRDRGIRVAATPQQAVTLAIAAARRSSR